MGYSPWGHKESDTTEPHTHTHTHGDWDQFCTPGNSPPLRLRWGMHALTYREKSLIQTEGRGPGGLAELGVRGVLGWGLGSLRPCGASYTPVPSCSPSAAKRSWEQP